jgi:hypothetical protein
MASVRGEVECWFRSGEEIFDACCASIAACVGPGLRAQEILRLQFRGLIVSIGIGPPKLRAIVGWDQYTVAGTCAEKVHLIGGKNALPDYCVVDIVVPGNLSPRPDQRRRRSARRQHWYQHAVVSRTRSGAGLSRVLRASSEFELLLLRRPVLGVPAGQLVGRIWFSTQLLSIGTCPSSR